MSNQIADKLKKGMVLKIIIPVLLVCIVAGIWVLKNNQKDIPADADNSDFALDVTKELDLDKLKSYGLPIIIDFGADSCIPCKEMAPVLKELNAELKGKAIIRFVDVWKYQELAQGYPIQLIPTQIFFDADGKPFKPEDPDAMQMNLYATKDTDEHVFTTHEGGLTKDQLLAILEEMGLN